MGAAAGLRPAGVLVVRALGGLHVSVDVSARQLLDVTFPGTVAATLQCCGLAPERLWLEITESALAPLRSLLFDGLKIDRSFIEPVGHDPDAEAIVAAIQGIAGIRGLRVVAEGSRRCSSVTPCETSDTPSRRGTCGRPRSRPGRWARS